AIPSINVKQSTSPFTFIIKNALIIAILLSSILSIVLKLTTINFDGILGFLTIVNASLFAMLAYLMVRGRILLKGIRFWLKYSPLILILLLVIINLSGPWSMGNLILGQQANLEFSELLNDDIKPILFIILGIYKLLPQVLTPIFVLINALLMRRNSRIIKQSCYRNKLNLKKLSKAYHYNKFMLLQLFGVLILAWSIGIIAVTPHLSFLPSLVILIIIIVFTKKSARNFRRWAIKKKKQALKKRGVERKKIKQVVFEDKNKRTALLMLIFLVIFPIFFGFNFFLNINCPDLRFAINPVENRIETSSAEIEPEYKEKLEELTDITINDEILIKGKVSPSAGHSVKLHAKLKPIEITSRKKNDPYMLSEFEFHSPYLSGPLKDSELILRLNFNKYQFLPGIYIVAVYFVESYLFSVRLSQPNIYFLELKRDFLKVLPMDSFASVPGSYHGAVYTLELEEEKAWKVVFNGKVVNSLDQPIKINKLDLFLERFDKYERIATISTDSNGRFHHEILIHGIFEINAISLISANETERYKALQHEEYAGLDLEGHEGAILPDLDNDGVPDEWPFSLGDLLLALSGEQSFPSGLRFMAKFDEGSGNVVIDDVQGLKGKLKGNATWSVGKDGKGSIRFKSNNIKTFGIEAGHLNISNTIDQGVVETINFKNVYENPVVVAYIYTRNNGESLGVRIDNVTSTSCQIFMEEPPDGAVTYT
ncbi:MAG: hypothetical protein DRP09_21125, partial [Candidatus Thorarchaeota archaeon]